MQLKYNSVDSFVIDLGDFLSSRGVVTPQITITEVQYAVKNAADNSDGSELATLTLGDGLEWVSDTQLSAQFDYSDYGGAGMQIGGVYVTGIGFKSATWTKWFEASLDDSSLEIIQDFFHD